MPKVFTRVFEGKKQYLSKDNTWNSDINKAKLYYSNYDADASKYREHTKEEVKIVHAESPTSAPPSPKGVYILRELDPLGNDRIIDLWYDGYKACTETDKYVETQNTPNFKFTRVRGSEIVDTHRFYTDKWHHEIVLEFYKVSD